MSNHVRRGVKPRKKSLFEPCMNNTEKARSKIQRGQTWSDRKTQQVSQPDNQNFGESVYSVNQIASVSDSDQSIFTDYIWLSAVPILPTFRRADLPSILSFPI